MLPQAPPAFRLTVASYNIHGGTGSDGVRSLERIARVVRALRADIVALQEVSGGGPQGSPGDAADEMGRLTGMQVIRGFTMKRGGGDYGNLLLSRFAPSNVVQMDLAVRGREPRGALDVSFFISGARVRVIATHLGLLPGERRTQAKLLIEHVRTGAAGDEAATLLMGDINEWWALGRPLRWLHRCFEGRAHGGRTFPARWPLLALDRIWVHPKRALVAHSVFHGHETRVASDHLPVRVELAVPVTAASVAHALEQGDGQPRKQAVDG
jgi:endonuclease/exonuclease/phosphatase family metal-dependent hydrolase